MTTTPRRRPAPSVALLLVLAAIALVGAIVLAGIGKSIPGQLWTAFFAALTGGAGVAHPGTGQGGE